MIPAVLLALLLSGSGAAQTPVEERCQIGANVPGHIHEDMEAPPEAPRMGSGMEAVRAALERVSVRRAEGAVRTLHVGPDATYRSLAAAVAASDAGDTLVVHAGVYRGGVRIRHPVVVIGRDGAVLDGGGEGTVLTLTDAPGSLVQGLTVRASGRTLAHEDAGLMAENSPGVVVANNRFDDVLFGIYLKQSADSRILGNEVVGADLEIANRGDAIRLWYSPDALVGRNRVRGSRDVVIWFSDSVQVLDNDVTEGRYALHYMYSDHGRFTGNHFQGNLVGGFLMYSTDLEFTDNVFAESEGATGMGLGLKDSDIIVARDNLFVRNAVGIHLDNSPQTVGVRNHFEGNLLVENETGVFLLPSVAGNDFEGNLFEDNIREVVVSGGGDALENSWRENYWSRYAGFDADEDGMGDTPFVLSRLSDQLLTRRPELKLFTLSPAAATLDVLARILPFLEPRPVVIDEQPRLRPSRSVDLEQTGPPSPWERPAGLGLIVLFAGLSVWTLFLRRAPYPTGEVRR